MIHKRVKMSITFYEQLNVDNVDNFVEKCGSNCMLLSLNGVMH